MGWPEGLRLPGKKKASAQVDTKTTDDLVANSSGISPAPLDDAEMRTRGAAAKDAEQNVSLKKTFAWALLALLALQLAATNVAFYIFAASASWHISDSVMLGWMAATVVEVIGIVLVVVKNLFPTRAAV